MKNLFIFLTIINFLFLQLFSLLTIAQGNYYWKPVSGNNANSGANWAQSSCGGTTGTVPSSSDTIIYSSCSNSNCTINLNFSVAKINVQSTYSGTITMSSTKTLTAKIGIFKGGTFNGGDSTITITKSLTIDGTSFTSTSGALKTTGEFTFNSGTFTHNSGRVIFRGKADVTNHILGNTSTVPTLSLYNAEFAADIENTQFSIDYINLVVNHDLKLSGEKELFLNSAAEGIILAKGNVISAETYNVGGGTVTINITGTETQTLSDTDNGSGTGKLPNIKIDKTGGTLYLVGNLILGGGTTFEYDSGTINAGTSKLICHYSNTLKNASKDSLKLYDVDFEGTGDQYFIIGTITVGNNLTTSLSGDIEINSGGTGGILEVRKDIQWNNTGTTKWGSITYKFTKAGTQSVSCTSSTPQFYNIILNKSGGQVTLQKELRIANSATFTNGYIVTSGTNLLTFLRGSTVSSASNSSFARGPVKKIGDDAFTFPIGKASDYMPIAITAPSDTGDVFVAEYFNSMEPLGFDRSGLTYISKCEYWNLTHATGSSAVKVTLNWNTQSCDIYTLSTLKIGRWSGSQWESVGSISTTGNTSAGSIQTSSNQSSFGYFLIAKNSPALTVNAGTDSNIDLGDTKNLGGSPTASGGVSPYTYHWINPYALSSATASNPNAQPFSSYSYYLVVTDLDQTTVVDTVTVSVTGFDLKSAANFPLLAEKDITVSSPLKVTGKVGSNGSVYGDLTATEGIIISTTEVDDALSDLQGALDDINRLSAESIDSRLDGVTFDESGIYRISSDATLDGTLTFEGDANSYFIIDIDRASFYISDASSIVLNGVTKNQVYFRVDGSVAISGSATLNGIFLLTGDFTGDVQDGKIEILSEGNITGTFPPIWKNISIGIDDDTKRTIEDFFGYNCSLITKEDGIASSNYLDKTPEANPWLLRFPGGANTNWWRWRSGWFRGYNNPLYNQDENPNSGEKYGDDYPLPDLGIAYTLDQSDNANPPNLDYITDFKTLANASGAIPIFNLNLLTSDIGTEISFLFKAHCLGLPINI